MSIEHEWACMERVVEVASDASHQDSFEGVALAIIYVGERERDAALAVPGGFPIVKARQIATLESVLACIRKAEPDLEMSILAYEGDRDAMIDLVKRRLAEAARKIGE